MTTEPRSHQLLEVRIGDDPAAWQAAGFRLTGGRTRIARTAVAFAGEGPGISSVAVAGLTPGPGALDGIDLHAAEPLEPRQIDHPNHVVAIDHLVVMTPDCDRTTAAFEALGLAARRVRRFGPDDAVQRQTFFWLGDVIAELVGPDVADPEHASKPATAWGLALSSDDLDATAAELGHLTTEPKDAVQRGRRISTIKTRDLGISTALAVLSPHPT